MPDFIQWVKALPEIWKSVFTILMFVGVFLIYLVISKRIRHIQSGRSSVDKEAIDDKRVLQNTVEENVKLIDVDEELAAVIMAVTAENLGKPVEKLRFKSIRRISEPILLEEVSDDLAAVIMAITSYNTKVPLEKLRFSSIKLISD
ncbi:MAG: hypothetical protein BWY46_00636 [Firmicutes bacterium ADurb.Bin300]|jgi:hypothetical protein|nr:MAG: hypothetical protein BWY46_00636 [Firmicutes bacterium ADurb.Bin300]HOD02352.1 hypothetical protein [Clostridiales bacterium]